MIIPFSTENVSVGNPKMFHSRIFTCSPNVENRYTELIWNDDAREKVSEIAETMTNKYVCLSVCPLLCFVCVHIQVKEDPSLSWKLPDDFTVPSPSQVEGEVEVGGVYLRLFIQQPSWVLRKPKEFLVAILDKFGQITQSSSPNAEVLETVTTAIVCLFIAQPSLADQVPPMGHIPCIFACMKSKNDSIPKSCVQVALVPADSLYVFGLWLSVIASCLLLLP
ncbi:dnaJ homolog subfamily C member 13-like [Dysidea avara]|uniref:dnaJ homolog subfamily C member 13-like n=1 Tax=Dysidea avara TaxID=196820 RepID=UPI00331F12F2